jgi:hypothetical protein
VKCGFRKGRLCTHQLRCTLSSKLMSHTLIHQQIRFHIEMGVQSKYSLLGYRDVQFLPAFLRISARSREGVERPMIDCMSQPNQT